MIPFPAIDVMAWAIAGGTGQQQRTPAVPWQHPPDDTQNCSAPIGSLQLRMIGGAVRTYAARQPHSFLDLAVSLVLPDQQVRDSSRIVEIASHKPSRDDGHVLAVESRPETEEIAVPSAPLLPLLHRLIPLIILSGKIPVTWRVRKESIKVRTPESPPFSDDSPFDLSSFDVLPHRARVKPQDFSSLADRQQSLSNRCRLRLCSLRHCTLPFPSHFSSQGSVVLPRRKGPVRSQSESRCGLPLRGAGHSARLPGRSKPCSVTGAFASRRFLTRYASLLLRVGHKIGHRDF